MTQRPFHSPYSHGFVRAAVCLSPRADRRAPSDSGAGVWPEELRRGVPG